MWLLLTAWAAVQTWLQVEQQKVRPLCDGVRWHPSLALPLTPFARPQEAFCVGEMVEMKDNGENWKVGHVRNLNPLKVSFESEGNSGNGYGWDSVRKLQQARPFRDGLL